jgi:flavin-dependent dehydrogenase
MAIPLSCCDSHIGEIKGTFTRGVELVAKQTLFAEGARGSCSKTVIEKFNLAEGKDVQTYGLGTASCYPKLLCDLR